MPQQNIITLVRNMLDSGASVNDVISSLRELGIPREDAERIILLANRDLLLRLRSDIREIVKEVFDAEKDELERSIREDTRHYVDSQLKIINRNLLKMLRDEVGKYTQELSKVEERLNILDGKIFELEKAVFHRKGNIRVGRGISVGHLLVFLGLLLGGVALAVPLDPVVKTALGLGALIFIVGGAFLG